MDVREKIELMQTGQEDAATEALRLLVMDLNVVKSDMDDYRIKEITDLIFSKDGLNGPEYNEIQAHLTTDDATS